MRIIWSRVYNIDKYDYSELANVTPNDGIRSYLAAILICIT